MAPNLRNVVEFASSVRNACAVSIDVHGLILTDFFAYARTIHETGDRTDQTSSYIDRKKEQPQFGTLINVQESNVPFRALNNIIPSLPLHRLEPTPLAIP